MKQYCSGIDEATLIATLEAKFKATHEGWINERLQIVIDERNIYSLKQSQNGKIGQFYKKAKEVLNAKKYLEIRKLYEDKTNDEFIKRD